MKTNKLITAVLLFIILGVSALIFAYDQADSQLLGDVHEHADFKVYLLGEAHDFAQDKYMSSKDDIQSNFVHLHDGDGEVVHKHLAGITLGTFFETLGMQFTSDCFTLDDGQAFCNDEENRLRLYVNGKRNFRYGDYEFFDLDQILITYGSEDKAAIAEQLASLTDKACIQSGSCPERGAPSDESSCLTGSECIPEEAHSHDED